MKNTFDKGIAFICEGPTEKEFYLSLLEFFCEKYKAIMEKQEVEDGTDIVYKIALQNRIYMIKFHSANAISGIPKAGKWFEAECIKKYGVRNEWEVFLCYDTDNYKNEISQFQEGDWKDLRGKLSKAKKVVDLAAAADIEDVLLVDLSGICKFIDAADITIDKLSGRKGSAKMKQLYRGCGKSYHKGERARPMIDSLDKQKIIDSRILPLNELEKVFM